MNAAMKMILGSLVGVLFAFSLAFVGIRAMGYATFVVTGGSMEPTIHKGSLVIDEPVTADRLHLGDIITFDHYDQITTHRIVGVEGSAAGTMYSTKGDANEITDPEPLAFPGRVGLVRFSVPYVGYAVAWMQYAWRLGATVVAAIIFFACAAMIFLKRDAKPAAAKVATKPARPAKVPAPSAAMSLEARRIWAEHEHWMQQNRMSNARAA
jgi:signal peptidase I